MPLIVELTSTHVNNPASKSKMGTCAVEGCSLTKPAPRGLRLEAYASRHMPPGIHLEVCTSRRMPRGVRLEA